VTTALCPQLSAEMVHFRHAIDHHFKIGRHEYADYALCHHAVMLNDSICP
jgi:hypothetical protein